MPVSGPPTLGTRRLPILRRSGPTPVQAPIRQPMPQPDPITPRLPIVRRSGPVTVVSHETYLQHFNGPAIVRELGGDGDLHFGKFGL